jgi:BirA family biotin operon repressor/biotin-[acetyl-CoA-carboxylase] ligase
LNLEVVPGHSAYPVTALKNHAKLTLDREIVFSELLAQIETQYQVWQREGLTPIREAWMERAHGLDQEMTITVGKNQIHGQFMGLNPEGALLLKEANGLVHTVMSAEVC